MEFPLEAQHPLSSKECLELLTQNENFRVRLHFEMGDDDVVVDGRNINYSPTFPEIPAPVRIYQTDKIKYSNDFTGFILVTKFLFNVSGRFFGVKNVRKIYPDDGDLSHSVVTIEIKKNEVDERLQNIFQNYVIKRNKEQNKLIAISSGKQSSGEENFPIPFNDFFLDVRNSISDLEVMLREEHEIDHSISLASSELTSLKLDLEKRGKQIFAALQEREAIAEEVRQVSAEVAKAADNIGKTLAAPQKDVVTKDAKNDVAFAFSLIPLFVAFFGAVITRKKK